MDYGVFLLNKNIEQVESMKSTILQYYSIAFAEIQTKNHKVNLLQRIFLASSIYWNISKHDLVHLAQLG